MLEGFTPNKFFTLSKGCILTWEWHEVFSYFEYLNGQVIKDDFKSIFTENINEILREHNSSYSFVEGKFIPVDQPIEIEEIEQVTRNTLLYNLKNVDVHREKAIRFFSLRPEPDLANTIKESITMVESIARIIEPENSLGKALSKLNKKGKINSELKSGFEKLYSYTNSEDGIRHAKLNDNELDVETAKFFLVSCSAFTNYLIEKGRKEGLFNI